jgi:hypothetical protein
VQAIFLYSTDEPIILEDDVNHQIGVCTPPRRTQHRQELGRGYDSRIPIQLRISETEDVTATDREYDNRFEADGRSEEEKGWEYDGFSGYRVTGGTPEVAVCWRPTWEPAVEFPPDEVAKMEEKWQRSKLAAKEPRSKKQSKRRGRPRQRFSGGVSTGGQDRSLGIIVIMTSLLRFIMPVLKNWAFLHAEDGFPPSEKKKRMLM